LELKIRFGARRGWRESQIRRKRSSNGTITGPRRRLTLHRPGGYKPGVDQPPDLELPAEERVLLTFGYLGPLALVTLVASRRELVKWHAKQGLMLWLALVLLYLPLRAVQLLLARHAWVVLGELLGIVLWTSVCGLVVMMLVGIIRGLEGERFRMPLVGEIADRL